MRGIRSLCSMCGNLRDGIDRMTTKTRIIIVTIALALGAGSTAQIVSAASAQAAAVSATRKGVIKKIDGTTIVLTPSDDKKREATYTLAPSATRTGQCDVGDDVVISYHYEKGKAVVTAVTGKS